MIWQTPYGTIYWHSGNAIIVQRDDNPDIEDIQCTKEEACSKEFWNRILNLRAFL